MISSLPPTAIFLLLLFTIFNTSEGKTSPDCSSGNKNVPCIQFCCHPYMEMLDNNFSSCRHLRPEENKLKYDPYIDMIYKNFSEIKRNSIEDFQVLQGIPCDTVSQLKPEAFTTDNWNIYENGELYLHHGNIIIKRTGYCLMPIRDERRSDVEEWKLTAFVCPTLNAEATYNFVWNIFGIMSILIIVITLTIYILLPELQSVRGKCVINYLLSLVIGNIMITIISMAEESLPNFLCSSVGFLTYFFYESSFIWINIIGYDLWQNSKHFGQLVEDNSVFRKYSAYTYGIAGIMTLTLVILQYSEMPEFYKPGITAGVCWLNTSTWSALFYFFGLNAFIFCLNIVFYILTNSRQVTVSWLPNGGHASYRKGIRIYFILLCIVCVSWCINLGYYIEDLLQPNGSHLMSYLSDIMSSLEGPLLFWLLIVKTDTIYLIIRRKTIGSAYEPQLTEYSEDEFTSQF